MFFEGWEVFETEPCDSALPSGVRFASFSTVCGDACLSRNASRYAYDMLITD